MPIDDIDNLADTPSTWPPPIYTEDDVELENTSGLNTTVPPEIASIKWNWAAFLLGPIWALANSSIMNGLGLIAVPIVAILLRMATGFHAAPIILIAWIGVDLRMRWILATGGNRIAWRRRLYPKGVPQFLAVQRIWFRISIVCAALGGTIAGYVIYHIVLAIFEIKRAFTQP